MLDALLPPQCLSCTAPVDRPGKLCAECWSRVTFIDGPVCASCGMPFEYDAGPEALCGACTRRQPAYDRARAVMRYDEHSRKLVLRFKYADRTHGAPAYGAWMARAGAGLLANAEFLVPVPLHRRRLFTRRYNQAAILAYAVGRATGIAVAPALLARIRPTPPQTGRSASERVANVRGAFAVRPGEDPKVEGRRLVLIDDVMTTGATVEACARTLAGAGAARVDVLILARVVRPRAQAI